MREDGPGCRKEGFDVTEWNIPKRDRRMPLLFLSSFSPFLFPVFHFCTVPLVPPSGSGDDNYPANWGFVSSPVLIIHARR